MGIGNAEFPSFRVEFPWEWEPNHLTNGNGTEMGIAQMGIGTLIINLFPFSHNFFSNICICLR